MKLRVWLALLLVDELGWSLSWASFWIESIFILGTLNLVSLAIVVLCKWFGVLPQ